MFRLNWGAFSSACLLALSALCLPSPAETLSAAEALNLFQLVDHVYQDANNVWPKDKLPDFLRKVESSSLRLQQSQRPDGILDSEWSRMEARNQRAFAWVRMQLRDQSAERELMKTLAIVPDDGEVAYWLGSVLTYKGIWPMAVFYFARAASVEGPSQLSQDKRSSLRTYAYRLYESKGGTAAGFSRVLELAKVRAFPPEDFDILNLR